MQVSGVNRGTTATHVQAVLAIDDRVLRNYWVTQTYSDLAAGLSRLLGPDTANWCTFGTWASDTVGRNIRGEDLPRWLHDRVVLHDGMMGAIRSVNEGPQGRLLSDCLHLVTPDHVMAVVRELLSACAMNLSNGNTEVFAEIAPAAATFIACYEAQQVDDASARARVLELCEGAPPFEGVNRLRAGFSLWCDAMEETAPVERSQLILAGSLQLGAHEQHHLQGAIAGSMDMGINQGAALYRERLVSENGTFARLAPSITSALDPLVRATGDCWGDLMTKLLGTIETPDGTLLLDHDVPPIPGQPFTPADVKPVVVDDLDTLLTRFDRSDGNGAGSAAADWVNLNDRMNFIANLFLSRHHRVELFRPPFDGGVRGRHRSGPHTGPEVLHRRSDSRAARPCHRPLSGRGASPTRSSRASALHPTDRPIRLSARSSRRVARVMRSSLCDWHSFRPAMSRTNCFPASARSSGPRSPGRSGPSRSSSNKARSSSVNGGPNSAWRCGWHRCLRTMPVPKGRSHWSEPPG